MTDFVLSLKKDWYEKPCEGVANNLLNHDKVLVKIDKYANFLRTPLNLSMFIPCKLVNGVWVVLEKPIFYEQWSVHKDEYPYADWAHVQANEYQEAKDKCIFNGFSLENKGEFTVWIQKDNHSICFTDRGKININSQNEINAEDVIKYEFILTQTAQKQLS